ncbi:MAG: family 20 glycosylhydrolase [Halioglobus sp.]
MSVAILPYPKTLLLNGGLCLKGSMQVVSTSTQFEEAAHYLDQRLLTSHQETDHKTPITLIQESSISQAEGYRLEVSESGVEIRASHPKGAFYGCQSLLQLVRQHPDAETLASMTIEDYPSYQWRGMHLDCSRNFFSLEFIKRYLDLLAEHKMNRFHWHLCDDQGWRMESKRFPRLTAVGAWRHRSVVGHTANRERQYEEQRYGGYYTQDEISEIIDYAAQRHIEVVPEIDIPGHAAALLAAHPELSCDGGQYQVEEHYGIFPDVLCPCEQTFEFLTELFAEVAQLFPFEYVHIGGDEVVKDHWQDCYRCQRLMQTHNMSSVDQLHGYFVARVETILSSLGRRAIGWNEVMEGEVNTSTTIMCWTGFDACREALQAGHEAIMTPVECTYFDFYQSTSLDEPQAIHGLATVKQVFDYDPLPAGVAESLRPRILGVQANVWTEYLRDNASVEYACLPRMCALSEVAWTGPERDWGSFCERLPTLLSRLENSGHRVAKSIYKPSIQISRGEGRSLSAEMHCEMPGMQVRYTTDGSHPQSHSALYRQALSIDKDCVLRCCSYTPASDASFGDERQKLRIHRGLFRTVYWLREGQLIAAPELKNLTNGCLGDQRIFHGFEWTQFNATASDMVLDLVETQPINGINLNFEAGSHRQLFFPSHVELLLSLDARTWTPLANVNKQGMTNGRIKINVQAFEARYVRLIIENKDTHYGPEQRRAITRPVHLDELIVD